MSIWEILGIIVVVIANIGGVCWGIGITITVKNLLYDVEDIQRDIYKRGF